MAEVSTAALEEANALAARFEAAAAAAADFPAGKLSSEQKLHLYGLFKQATVGPAPLAPTTSALDIVGRMKHQAWLGMRDLTRAAAMAKYGSYVESLQARDRRTLALSVRFLQVEPLASAIGEVRIEVLEAVGLLQATRPTAALLDLRSEVAFDEMHLQGAASFSLSTLPYRTAELPPSSSAGLHLLGASVAELAHARHFLNEQVC